MARPALSAARGLDIIDLLAAAPARGLTLSDLARAAGINVASCHAVLSVLVERGYLVRDAQTKTFRLGAMIHAAGQAALAAQPLLAHGMAAAKTLHSELSIPVMMSAAVGDEIVGIIAVGDPGGSDALLRPGARRPRIPPIGAPFVAWSGDLAIATWLASAPGLESEQRAALLRATETIRDRGFEILLRTGADSHLASQLRELAMPDGAIHQLGPDMALLERIEAGTLYPVTMIAAPIFDRYGTCAFNLCLGPFPQALPGSAILTLAERLVGACVEVMRADRAK